MHHKNKKKLKEFKFLLLTGPFLQLNKFVISIVFEIL